MKTITSPVGSSVGMITRVPMELGLSEQDSFVQLFTRGLPIPRSGSWADIPALDVR